MMLKYNGIADRYVSDFGKVMKRYWDLRNPSILKNSFAEYFRDISDIFSNRSYDNLEGHLKSKLSHSLVVSESVGVGGRFASVAIAQYLGADDISATICGYFGHMMSDLASFIAFYVHSTKNLYSRRQALKDSVRMAQDRLPSETVLGLTEMPFVSVSLLSGAGSLAAAFINTALDFTLSPAVAREVSRYEINIPK